jgi:SpoVK/Ycf46/Vps4 family AAA+-type ATPase
MLSKTPCIALVEDIDSIFNGRKNIRNTNNNLDLLTFDCFLNCIDGIQNTDGLFLIVTTNKIELLDSALGIPRTNKNQNETYISTRPGRIDRAFELKILDKDCRIKIAKRILSDCPEFIDKIIEIGNGDTGAQFQERCTQIALKNFWERKK